MMFDPRILPKGIRHIKVTPSEMALATKIAEIFDTLAGRYEYDAESDRTWMRLTNGDRHLFLWCEGNAQVSLPQESNRAVPCRYLPA